jgi:ankyrin repeat protein
MSSQELVQASDRGNIERVKSLIKSGVNVNFQEGEWKIAPLHSAASNGHKEIVEILIANGANINIVNKFNCTPLYFAACSSSKSYPNKKRETYEHGEREWSKYL